LFGEYNITNNLDLSVSLESLVKSLGITLTSESVIQTDSTSLALNKSLFSSSPPVDNISSKNILKSVSDEIDELLESTSISLSRTLNSGVSIEEQHALTLGLTSSSSILTADSTTPVFTKGLIETLEITEEISVGLLYNIDDTFSVEDALTISPGFVVEDGVDVASLGVEMGIGKHLESDSTVLDALNKDLSKTHSDTFAVTDTISINREYDIVSVESVESSQQGYIQLNSYAGEDYVVPEDEYSVGSRESIF
jgi:hypothetical protein